MSEQKKVLVLGGTGAMGRYIVPILADEMGYQVDALTKDTVRNRPNVHYYQCDAKDPDTLANFLSEGYDGIIDFMMYPTQELVYLLPQFRNVTDHYIYLSSYRVYDGKETPTKETSPLLIDTADSIALRNSDDYSIYKARGERMIRELFPKKNWTFVRPSITYSLKCYQLVTLQAPETVGRARKGKKVVLPEQAKNIQATMTWGGDSARMIASLLFNENALGEAFSIATAEHHTWGEIAEFYKDICGLECIWADKEEYLNILAPPDSRWHYQVRWQLEYDRLFNRIMDNSKVLSVTGLKQENFKKLYDGLSHEIGRCPADWCPDVGDHDRTMDAWLKKHC